MTTYSRFWGLASALKWIFIRLPIPFSLTFGIISVWWAIHGFHFADTYIAVPAQHIVSTALKRTPPSVTAFVSENLYPSNLDRFIDALVTLLCFVLGFVVAY